MPHVAVHDLSFAYPAVRPGESPDWTLRGIDLSVERGEFVAIMGPTDAGKSTLALALLGLVPHATGGRIRGEVRVAGMNTREHTVPELACKVGLVFQDPEMQFFNLTVESEVSFGLESLGVPRAEMAERIDRSLARVGLHGLEHRSPFALSGGQKQRAALAAVLAMQPEILVLDEPTASLDPPGQQEVFEVLDQLRRSGEHTVLLITHDSERVLQVADRVVVLADGRLVADGPPQQVFAQVELMRRLGLGLPQMLELADCLNRQLGTEYAFQDVEQARSLLSQGRQRS